LRLLRNCALLAFAASAGVHAASRVVAITVTGVIHPVTVEIVTRALNLAQSQHADLVLIRLNTPGGLLDATRRIIEELDASPIPVAAYVTPSGGRAASAGFFLLEASDFAAMAPGTNTGAASPVLLGQQMDPVMRSKVESDSAALLRTLTSRRGRNSALAEKTILEARAFTDSEALDQHLIELVAPNEQALLDSLNGREVVRFDGRKVKITLDHPRIFEMQGTARERLLLAIADPNVGFILLILGALGLYLEFSHPGLILPGAAGAVMLLLGLASLSVLPISWLGAALLILAFAFFGLEAKFAAHGILGVSGAVSMILGATLLVNGPPELRIHLSTAVAVTIPFALITVFLVSLAMRARASKSVMGPAAMLQEKAIAFTALELTGKVFVHGEYWDATSNRPVSQGSRVRITSIDGLTLRVEPFEEPIPSQT
jgi:membrane-bound serine protease (ClpP class)